MLDNTAMERHKKLYGDKYKEWRKPKNKNFDDGCSPSTMQVLNSLTCSKLIRGKSLRIQEVDAAEATVLSVGL